MNDPVISQWIADLGIWPLIVMVFPTVFMFRKYSPDSSRKKMASLLHAIAVFLFTVSAALIAMLEGSDLYLLLSLAVIAGAAYLLRDRMFPYRLTCPNCGHKHEVFTSDFKNIYFHDDHLCDKCRKAIEGEDQDEAEDEAGEEAQEQSEGEVDDEAGYEIDAPEEDPDD